MCVRVITVHCMKIPHSYIPLTEFQEQVLEGEMLGDGHLCISDAAINAKLMISRSIKDEEYLKYEQSVWQNYIKHNDIHYTKLFNNTYEQCSFYTKNNEAFTREQVRWYKDKVKFSPRDLKLSPVAIAHWICDDGHVTFNKLPYRFKIELSTHGFIKDDVDFLANQLCEMYKERFMVKLKNRKDKKYYIIRAYDSACRAVFEDIDPYFKMTRKRIWNKPESRFYSNQPPKQISKVDLFIERKRQVSEILSQVDQIPTHDLATKLGYKINKNGTINYCTLYKILKPYLDSGKIEKIHLNKENHSIIKVIKKCNSLE
jgi:hypothetical protein